jgi:hypothetical protein
MTTFFVKIQILLDICITALKSNYYAYVPQSFEIPTIIETNTKLNKMIWQ